MEWDTKSVQALLSVCSLNVSIFERKLLGSLLSSKWTVIFPWNGRSNLSSCSPSKRRAWTDTWVWHVLWLVSVHLPLLSLLQSHHQHWVCTGWLPATKSELCSLLAHSPCLFFVLLCCTCSMCAYVCVSVHLCICVCVCIIVMSDLLVVLHSAVGFVWLSKSQLTCYYNC